MWMNIYGSPMNQPNSESKRMMNENPELASNWKGRVLMQVTCESTEKPILKLDNIPEGPQQESRGLLKLRQFSIIAEVGQAINLPAAKAYKVKLLLGGTELLTDLPRSHKGTYCRFSHRFEQQTI